MVSGLSSLHPKANSDKMACLLAKVGIVTDSKEVFNNTNTA